MAEIPADELVLYKEKITLEAVRTGPPLGPDLSTFWTAVQDRVPQLSQLARKYALAVTISADAERSSFSQLNSARTLKVS